MEDEGTNLEHGGRLEGSLRQGALDAAPVGDGRQVDRQSHPVHEVGPRGAQDVEDGGAHGVADVVQLGRARSVQHLVHEGWKVVHPRLVQPENVHRHSKIKTSHTFINGAHRNGDDVREVPETVVGVLVLLVLARVRGAAGVGQPHVVARVRQQKRCKREEGR